MGKQEKPSLYSPSPFWLLRINYSLVNHLFLLSICHSDERRAQTNQAWTEVASNASNAAHYLARSPFHHVPQFPHDTMNGSSLYHSHSRAVWWLRECIQVEPLARSPYGQEERKARQCLGESDSPKLPFRRCYYAGLSQSLVFQKCSTNEHHHFLEESELSSILVVLTRWSSGVKGLWEFGAEERTAVLQFTVQCPMHKESHTKLPEEDSSHCQDSFLSFPGFLRDSQGCPWVWTVICDHGVLYIIHAPKGIWCPFSIKSLRTKNQTEQWWVFHLSRRISLTSPNLTLFQEAALLPDAICSFWCSIFSEILECSWSPENWKASRSEKMETTSFYSWHQDPGRKLRASSLNLLEQQTSLGSYRVPVQYIKCFCLFIPETKKLHNKNFK